MKPPDVLTLDRDRPDPAVLTRAAAELAAGRLVVFPTDTLYGLGGCALDPAVGRRVREAKGRPDAQPLPLVAADEDAARSLAAEWPEVAARLARLFWPGPLTLVVRAAAHVPDEVTAGTGTVAVRVPAHGALRALCAAAGPLISTSANRAGENAPLTCAEAVAEVGAHLALALDGGPGRPVPSTIVDLTGAPRLVRAGAVSREALVAVLPGLAG